MTEGSYLRQSTFDFKQNVCKFKFEMKWCTDVKKVTFVNLHMYKKSLNNKRQQEKSMTTFQPDQNTLIEIIDQSHKHFICSIKLNTRSTTHTRITIVIQLYAVVLFFFSF